MPECTNILPAERIRVFISSAQRDENGFNWSEVRQKIKNTLIKCVYLNPFIIEDETSTTPSLQFYQRQVERADVIVFLIKGEVRPGTSAEYAHAVKLKKPFLVYFLSHDNPDLSVTKLKKDLQDYDRCTYREITNYDSIETVIWNDLMNNIVRSFQDNCYSNVEESETHGTILSKETLSINTGLPSKTQLQKFNSCYNYLFDLLKVGYFKKDVEESDLHNFGCSLIKWLITGEWSISNTDILDFISGCSDIFSNEKWIQKRWDAIRSFNQGDLSKALLCEKEALECAKQANESSWIINNILIDCRNIENDISNMNNEFSIRNEFQDELSSQNNMVFLPVLDRYSTNIFEQIDKDRFRVDTASPYTQLLGTGLSNALSNLANYLFTSAVYGSITHLQLTRRFFSHVLTQYAKITGEFELAFEGLKQYILFGDNGDYKLYIKSHWDKLYPFVATRADELWELTAYTPVQYQDRIKKELISTIGLYFSDDSFEKAEDYLFSCAPLVYWGNSEAFFETILNTLGRLNPEKVITAITPIISEKRFHLGNKLSHIILYIDLGLVSDETLSRLACALKDSLPFIINNNGDPQLVAALVERSGDIFGFLETLDGNGLEGLQLSLYKINTGEQNWLPILKEEIEVAKSQFEANSNEGIFHGFAFNPYSMISMIVHKNEENQEIDQLLQKEFIPLAIDVLDSCAAVQTKEACVACLCDVLSSFNERKISIPDDLIKAVEVIDLQKGSEFFASSTRKTLEIRVLMAKFLCGLLDTDCLLQWCVEFHSLETKERIVLIDCIDKYLYHQNDDVDSLIVSIVMQCSSDDNSDVRKIAYQSMSYIISKNQSDRTVHVFNNGVFDPADKVRFNILSLCREGILPEKIADSVIELLCNDANYILRERAKGLRKL